MTAIASPQTRTISAWSRISRVVKLHFANPRTVVGMPWMILGIIFLMNLAIWWMIVTLTTEGEKASEGFQYNGASGFIFVYMLVVAVLAMNQTFSLALGLSATRRDYYLGTALTFGILAVMYTAGFVVLGAIERATNGWGVGGRMFSPVYFGDTWYAQAFCVFVALLFFLFVGSISGAIYVRYKAFGITLFWCLVALGLIGGAALVTLVGAWGAVGNFFATAGLVGSFAWSLVPTAIAAIAGFFVLRRATPRS